MRKLLLLLLLLFTFIGFAGCGEESVSYTISGDSAVEVGKTITLTHDYDGEEKVTWTSSDNTIATITDGIVLGVKPGEVTIKIDVEGKSAEKKVTVVKSSIVITISGENSLYVGENLKLNVSTSFETANEVTWSSSDETKATVSSDGTVTGIGEGEVTIYAEVLGEKGEFKISVSEKVIPVTYKIVLSGDSIGYVGDEAKLNPKVEPELEEAKFIYKSSDADVATISSDGTITLKSSGKVTFTVVLENDESVSSSFEMEVKSNVDIIYDNEMMQGKYNYFKVYKRGEEITKEIEWKVNDPKLAIISENIMLAVNKGTVIVNAISEVNNINESFEVEIKPFVSDKPSEEDIQRVDEIISNMTLSQKIGQMFVVGFNGTTLPDSLLQAVNDYNFGNVIYMGYNVTSPSTLSALTDSIQNLMIEKNTVLAFISTDQEGGRVARLTNGGTHFISNMALAATNDYNNTYLEGVAMGQELRNYGINVNFAPVLDVNNNPNNPIIGIRSYSDNPLKVGLFGVNMFAGMQSENVMGCSKHFPGHGNTSVDSHYGLPQIDTKMDELYQTELAPFISAISNGIDSIMTTHIIFSAIDKTYPATLSEKVLTDLLRNELGFEGLIITDGMEMDAVSKNFGGYDQTAIKAVKAGVDILTYTTIANPITAHKALMNAVKNNEISEERINESVKRILLKKLKYDILDNPLAKNNDLTELLKANEELNIKFAMNSLTQVKGEFNGLNKEDKILIISPETSYDLGDHLSSNSFANYAWNYLKNRGYNCDYEVISNNISKGDSSTILQKAKEYDQVIVALSNVKTSGYSRSASFVNNLSQLNNKLLVIALDTPYDIMSYNNVENYICVYGYQKASVIALSKYLNGEFSASGVCPIQAIK